MKMHTLLLLLVLLVAAFAAPQIDKTGDVQIVRTFNGNDGVGSYKYDFEQSDGTKRNEEGNVINLGTDEESIIVEGSYSWVGPDNVIYNVKYVADDKGFQPIIEQGPGGQVPQEVITSLLG